MATPQMRVQSQTTLAQEKSPDVRRSGARLLDVDRSSEIFPLLLEEIVSRGYRSALVVEADFETGQVAPTVVLNCSRASQQLFRTSLYATENAVVQVLQTQEPALLPVPGRREMTFFCYPLLLRREEACREVAREGRDPCLAVRNLAGDRSLTLREQVCSTCHVKGYGAVVAVEVARNTAEQQLGQLRELIEFANRCYSRLLKLEHYYRRISEMEATIAQMQTVMQSMADPVILTDAQHRVVLENRAAERFFRIPEGVSEGRVRAVELNNLLFSAALSSLAVSGSEHSRDLTLVDAIEGEEVLFEAVSAATHGRDGRQTGMVTVMRDVTDLRRADEELRSNYERLRGAEEAVRQERDRLNLILENVGEPIVVCDHDAAVVMQDPLAQELFGAGKDASRHSFHVRNQARFDTYISGFTYSFSDRSTAPLRLYGPAAGAEVEYDARSGKIYDERGQVSFTVTVLRDLTAVRRLEQLRLERRMLEMEKFAASGRLAGTIAHEVNNPMEAIKNCIYLLSDSVKPESVPVYQILKSETERVARIVRQMLGLYRATEQVSSLDVNSVVEDTMLLFSRQLERSGITINMKLGQLPPVMGSADQLRQVLSNLVVNAKDGMGEGGVLIVRTRLQTAAGTGKEWACLTVADSGTGIPEAVLQSIFEPFITTKGEKGTGLGLWIVKGIVEGHGGRIRVRSRPGRGTIFRIHLPVVR
jgi:signal transduction histidine kinase